MNFEVGDYFFFLERTNEWILARITKIDTRRILFDTVIWNDKTSSMQRAAAEGWMQHRSRMATTSLKMSTSQDKQTVIRRLFR